MSKFNNQVVRCAVCNKLVKQTVMMSSNSFGFPDLDGRPAGMMREAMVHFINICPNCGYAHGVLDLLYFNAKEIVNSEEYQRLRKELPNETAKKFYLAGYIEECNNEPAKAYQHYRHAAWMYDDSGHIELAKKCREKSIACLDQLDHLINDVLALYIDMKRRIGAFDDALKIIEEKEESFKGTDKEIWLELEKELCLKKDDKVHNYQEVYAISVAKVQEYIPTLVAERLDELIEESEEIVDELKKLIEEKKAAIKALELGKISEKEYKEIEKNIAKKNKELTERRREVNKQIKEHKEICEKHKKAN